MPYSPVPLYRAPAAAPTRLLDGEAAAGALSASTCAAYGQPLANDDAGDRSAVVRTGPLRSGRSRTRRGSPASGRSMPRPLWAVMRMVSSARSSVPLPAASPAVRASSITRAWTWMILKLWSIFRSRTPPSRRRPVGCRRCGRRQRRPAGPGQVRLRLAHLVGAETGGLVHTDVDEGGQRQPAEGDGGNDPAQHIVAVRREDQRHQEHHRQHDRTDRGPASGAAGGFAVGAKGVHTAIVSKRTGFGAAFHHRRNAVTATAARRSSGTPAQ